jgi:hypothetical protein
VKAEVDSENRRQSAEEIRAASMRGDRDAVINAALARS